MEMARLVIFFAVHPGGRYHVRELASLIGLATEPLQSELDSLTNLGALVREESGSRACYRPDESHSAWYAWFRLLRDSARLVDVLREALQDALGVQGAFVFGSYSRGDARSDSDIDIFLIGSREARTEAGYLLLEAEFLVNRELHVIGYDAGELARRIESGNAFVQRVLSGPRKWLRGSDEVLPLRSASWSPPQHHFRSRTST